MSSDKIIKEKNIKINIFGKIAKQFIDQFQLTLLVMIMIASIGFVGLQNLPKESLPEIVFPAITIQTLFPGASPEDVEFLVTEKIENKIKDFDDIDSLESDTSFGFSVVTITFNEGVDIEQKKIEVDNSLMEIQFSDGINEPVSRIFKTSEIPLMNISVAGNYDIEQLSSISENIKSKIESVRGVEDVSISGTASREIEIVVDELKMMKYGIDFETLRSAISSKNFNLPIGELSLNGVRFNLRVDERYKNTEEIENTLIVNKSGQRIYVKEIAEVIDGLEPINSINRTYINDRNDEALPSVFMTVSRRVNSDVVTTSQKIHQIIDDGAGSLYPEDVTVYISNDMAVSVSSDLEKIKGSAFSGLIVVVIVLFLFIGIKESVIVSITIPLSLLGTLGILNFFDITFNTFAILGLIVALGLLVDNSIIVMENIDRLKKLGLNSYEAALYGTNQVGFPIVSATSTTLAAFFPLVILPGILGAFVSTIPLTIMITISVSLLVSLVVTPSIASRILKTRKKSKIRLPKFFKLVISTGFVGLLSYYAFYSTGNSILTYSAVVVFSTLMFIKTLSKDNEKKDESKAINKYSDVIGWIVDRKLRSIIVLIIGGIALLASFSTFSTGRLKISFFPKAEPNSININIDTAGGMTLSDTSDVASTVEEILYDTIGVTQFNTTVGGTEVDLARISVEIDSEKYDGFEVLDNIQKKVSLLPGGKINIEGLVSGPPVGKPIEIKILGESLEDTNRFAKELESGLKSIDGVYNIESSSTVGVPQIVFDINQNKSLIYGTSSNQIALQLRGEINGIKATTIIDNGEEIDIVLRKDLDMIDTKEQIENLFIATKYGNMLTLSSFAKIDEQGGISNISRIDGERVITITADLKKGYNVTETVDKIKNKYAKELLPYGIGLSYSGDVEGIEQNFGNLFQSMILAIFLVFIILTLQFKSIGQPFIILSTIPMALIGVIWGLIITGNEFGFYAFMGLVALVGIAVNDAIVLIDYMNYLRNEGMERKTAIMEAARTRFNPVLATTLTTISGVLPLAFKEAYYAQFSFALIFGLLMTTILTLVFIPILYGLYERIIIRKVV